ncbi:MAG: hypothetical protein H7226_08585, partial [Salinibacterium sp.]|nr:hypothetical protein [Salinibacterium sp.]
YGQQVSVQVRACRTPGSVPLCESTWSAAFAFGVPGVRTVVGQLTFTPDVLLLPNSGTFQWNGLPTGYDLVEYACGAPPSVFTTPVDETTCHADAGPQDPQLIIRVTANGTTYTKTYNGLDYD